MRSCGCGNGGTSIERIEDPTGYLFRVALNGFRMRRRRAAIALRRGPPRGGGARRVRRCGDACRCATAPPRPHAPTAGRPDARRPARLSVRAGGEHPRRPWRPPGGPWRRRAGGPSENGRSEGCLTCRRCSAWLRRRAGPSGRARAAAATSSGDARPAQGGRLRGGGGTVAAVAFVGSASGGSTFEGQRMPWVRPSRPTPTTQPRNPVGTVTADGIDVFDRADTGDAVSKRGSWSSRPSTTPTSGRCSTHGCCPTGYTFRAFERAVRRDSGSRRRAEARRAWPGDDEVTYLRSDVIPASSSETIAVPMSAGRHAITCLKPYEGQGLRPYGSPARIRVPYAGPHQTKGESDARQLVATTVLVVALAAGAHRSAR